MSKLQECFVAELASIHDAETQLTKALPEMAQASKHQELKAAFDAHKAETEEHIVRLEEIFAILGEKVPSRKCQAIQSLIAEGQAYIDDELGDAALICAAQKIEHYEIASYGCLRSWAQFLDHDEAANLLDETLDEENVADEHLTSLAVQIINLDAQGPDEDEEAEKPLSKRRKSAGSSAS
jgi:ferritin-like metal-binding protein YciE